MTMARFLGTALFDGELVARREAAAGGEGLPDEFILELHGAVPGIALQAVLLPGELVGLVEVNVLPGLAAGGHVHVIERQHVGFEAADLHRRRWRRAW